MKHARDCSQHIFLIGLGEEGLRILARLHEHFSLKRLPTGVKLTYLYPDHFELDTQTAIPPLAGLNIDRDFFCLKRWNSYDQITPEHQEEIRRRLGVSEEELEKLSSHENREMARFLLAANGERTGYLLQRPFNHIEESSKVWVILCGALGEAATSGTLVDIAFLVRQAAKEPLRGRCSMTAVLWLPPETAKEVENANAYTVLRELKHYLQAGHTDVVYTPLIPPFEAEKIVAPLLDQVMLLPGAADEAAQEQNELALAEWLKLCMHRCSLVSRASRPSLEAGQFGSFGAAWDHPLPPPAKDVWESVITGLMRLAKPRLVLEQKNLETTSRMDWTVIGLPLELKSSLNTEELIQQVLQGEDASQSPQPCSSPEETASVTLTLDYTSTGGGLVCICEQTNISIRNLRQLKVFKEAYLTLKKSQQFPERVGQIAEIELVTQKEHRQPFLLARHKINAGEIQITAVSGCQIKADYLLIPFSSEPGCPGESATSLLEKGGEILVRQLYEQVNTVKNPKPGYCYKLRSDCLETKNLWMVYLPSEQRNLDFQNVSEALERTFKAIQLKSATIVLPLFCLTPPDSPQVADLVDCMYESVSQFLIHKEKEWTILFSFQQPEAIAAAVEWITSKNDEDRYQREKQVSQFELNYPFPIANPYHQLIYAREWDKNYSNSLAITLEAALGFLASIALAEYFSNPILVVRKPYPRELVNRGNLTAGILREFLIHIGQILLEEDDLFLPDMKTFYTDAVQSDGLINILINLRNLNTHTAGEKKNYIDLLDKLFEKMRVLSDYRLISVGGARNTRSTEEYSCVNLTGCDPAFHKFSLRGEVKLARNSIYLIHGTRNEVLCLSPMLKSTLDLKGRDAAASYRWLLLYTIDGINSETLRYKLRTLERCPLKCSSEQMYLLEDKDKSARRDFENLCRGILPPKMPPLRQKSKIDLI